MDEREPQVPTDEAIEDLEADDDADKVLGGRVGDPCDGGE